ATPDKVFGVTDAWAQRHPQTLDALVRSLLRASAWADDPANRDALASILARPEFVGAPAEVLRLSLVGSPPYAPGDAAGGSLDYIVYHRYAASFPWRSHAMWF